MADSELQKAATHGTNVLDYLLAGALGIALIECSEDLTMFALAVALLGCLASRAIFEPTKTDNYRLGKKTLRPITYQTASQ